MHILVFAGGVGKRLWPLSRVHSPKQFEILKGDKSTLQMAMDRVHSFGMENIYVSTNEKYVETIQKQVPGINDDHIIKEPTRRDLAAAVGLGLVKLKNIGVTGPIAILWSDHFMQNPESFVDALKKAEGLVTKNPNKVIFLGEKPRFANHNLGWIHAGTEQEDGTKELKEFIYRPDIEVCKEMFSSREWFWNPGYFISSIEFLISLYKKFQPEMYAKLEAMAGNEAHLSEEYGKLDSMSFDNAILEHVAPEEALVIPVDLGWSDPGTLYALKEALQISTEENVTHGKVLTEQVTDALIHNEEKDKLVTVIGLDGVVVVNTKDALLVCHKDKIPEIKTMLSKIEDQGWEEYL